MSIDRDVVNLALNGGTLTTKANEETRTNDPALLEKLKARFVQILDRGFTNDRLDVKLPDDMHGEWVLNDPLVIQQYKEIGFDLDTEYAKANGIMSNGDGSVVMGDVVFMTCRKELKDFFNQVERDRFKQAYSRKEGKSRAEREAMVDAARSGADVALPSLSTSERVLNVSELQGALKS